MKRVSIIAALVIVTITVILTSIYVINANLAAQNTSADTGVNSFSEVWFGRSNGGNAGGSLPDYKELFNSPEKWAKSRSRISVFQFHVFDFDENGVGSNNTFLKEKIIPLLYTNGIRIALNVTGGNLMQCGNRDQLMHKEEEVINKIHRAGGEVKYLNMQSTLSKYDNRATINAAGCPTTYSQEQIIQDIKTYISYMKSKFPNIKIGITDADATQGQNYKQQIRQLTRLLDQNNLSLDFFILDNASAFKEKRGSLNGVLEVESFIQNEIKIPFGIIFTAVNDDLITNSNKSYMDQTLSIYDQYKALGGKAQINLLTSWLPFPNRYLSEDAENDAPLTKTLLELGQKIIRNEYALKPTDTVTGRVGIVNRAGRITGWIYDKNNPTKTFHVFFYIDGGKGSGQFVGSTIANIERDEVGNHGFRFNIPRQYFDNNWHTIYVYAGEDVNSRGRSVELTNSPMTFDLSPL